MGLITALLCINSYYFFMVLLESLKLQVLNSTTGFQTSVKLVELGVTSLLLLEKSSKESDAKILSLVQCLAARRVLSKQNNAT